MPANPHLKSLLIACAFVGHILSVYSSAFLAYGIGFFSLLCFVFLGVNAWNQELYTGQSFSLIQTGLITAAISALLFWIKGRLGDPTLKHAERMVKKVLN